VVDNQKAREHKDVVWMSGTSERYVSHTKWRIDTRSERKTVPAFVPWTAVLVYLPEDRTLFLQDDFLMRIFSYCKWRDVC